MFISSKYMHRSQIIRPSFPCLCTARLSTNCQRDNDNIVRQIYPFTSGSDLRKDYNAEGTRSLIVLSGSTLRYGIVK